MALRLPGPLYKVNLIFINPLKVRIAVDNMNIEQAIFPNLVIIHSIECICSNEYDIVISLKIICSPCTTYIKDLIMILGP